MAEDLMLAYNEFVGKNSTVFDIGAYVGGHTDMFLSLGCRRVVAVEPVEEYYLRLCKKYERDTRVTVLRKAAGPVNGEGVLKVHKANWSNGARMDSALSTMSGEWLTGIDDNADKWDEEFKHPDWLRRSPEWSEEQRVETVTIDTLVNEYGEPDFIKIDVEGWEREVIKGLTRPVKALSFEFNTLLKLEWAEAVVEHLLGLRSYEFNYDLQDGLELVSPAWLSQGELFASLRGQAVHGDIFARQS